MKDLSPVKCNPGQGAVPQEARARMPSSHSLPCSVPSPGALCQLHVYTLPAWARGRDSVTASTRAAVAKDPLQDPAQDGTLLPVTAARKLGTVLLRGLSYGMKGPHLNHPCATAT